MADKIVAFLDHEVGFRAVSVLHKQARQGLIDLVAIITPKRCGVEWWPRVDALCAQIGLPLFTYEELSFEKLGNLDADWYFLLSWKYLMPEQLLALPHKFTINLHYSLLPKLRGVYPVNWALIEGHRETGITFHTVDAQVDTGRLLTQIKMPILREDTARSLQLRLDDLAIDTLGTLVPDLVKGAIDPLSAPAQDNTKASYRSRKDFQAICRIDPDSMYRAQDLVNLLRGLSFRSDSRNAYLDNMQDHKAVHLHLSLSKTPS